MPVPSNTARVARLLGLALACTLALPACSHSPDTTAAPPAESTRAATDDRDDDDGTDATTGLASYYATKFEGRRTASGAVYHRDSLTAAHRTLPFGTRVRVTRLATGASVDVVVNDRGPFRKGSDHRRVTSRRRAAGSRARRRGTRAGRGAGAVATLRVQPRTAPPRRNPVRPTCRFRPGGSPGFAFRVWSRSIPVRSRRWRGSNSTSPPACSACWVRTAPARAR